MFRLAASASWINLVERFFGLITEDAIRRGVFHSVAELETAIDPGPASAGCPQDSVREVRRASECARGCNASSSCRLAPDVSPAWASSAFGAVVHESTPAEIASRLAAIGYIHFATTVATTQKAGEEQLPVPCRASLAGRIIGDHPLVPLELGPGDVALVFPSRFGRARS